MSQTAPNRGGGDTAPQGNSMAFRDMQAVIRMVGGSRGVDNDVVKTNISIKLLTSSYFCHRPRISPVIFTWILDAPRYMYEWRMPVFGAKAHVVSLHEKLHDNNQRSEDIRVKRVSGVTVQVQ